MRTEKYQHTQKHTREQLLNHIKRLHNIIFASSDLSTNRNVDLEDLVKQRGWKNKEQVIRFLGPASVTEKNHHHPQGAPINYWLPEDVLRAERRQDFKAEQKQRAKKLWAKIVKFNRDVLKRNIDMLMLDVREISRPLWWELYKECGYSTNQILQIQRKMFESLSK